MMINTSSLLFPIIAFIVIICAVVIGIVLVLRKKNSGSSDNPISATASMAAGASTAGSAAAVSPAAAVPAHAEAPGSAGEIKLYNVPDKQAAMAMAIIADHLNTPLNQLRFKSIKLVD